MSDGHDKHVILPDTIDDAEGKPRDDSFAILPAERGACSGLSAMRSTASSTEAANRVPSPLRRDS